MANHLQDSSGECATLSKATIPNTFTTAAVLDDILKYEYIDMVTCFDKRPYSDYVENTLVKPAYKLLTELANERFNKSLQLVKQVQDCMELITLKRPDQDAFKKCVSDITAFLASVNDFRLAFKVYFSITLIDNGRNELYKNELIDSISYARRTLEHLPFFVSSKRFLEIS